MRVVVVADTYPPTRISGSVQMRDLVREFTAQGHDTTVIVPSAALDQPWRLEASNGATVLRVRTPPTKDVNHVRRALNEMRLPHALLRGMRAAGVPVGDWEGVVWYSPTIFLAPIVKRIRQSSGCRSYLILRDIFPEWAVDLGLMGRGVPYRFFKWVEAAQYSVADTIGVQCAANLPYLARWAEQPGRTLEVLENWLSPTPIAHCRIDIAKTKLTGRRIFVYTGNMGAAQGMDPFLDMAIKMRDRGDVGFLFVGRGSEVARLAGEADRHGLDNVVFHDEIEPEEIPGLLAQCHVAMLALDPRHTSHNIPGKFLTYMQAGLPVLARVNPGNELEQLIREHRVGRVCVGGDGASLQSLAEDILADPALAGPACNRAQRLWESRFSTAAAVRQVAEALARR
jgi:glycosyltransferase involved in cell wall biosynthesis